ncbi:ferredoxin-type protein NapF [Colwellia sp. 1_MG-2023]|uniref:ferredoxin-type protein NapF n=1 Tax=Colwellia sp. 1_MG-2023 TaxID=3062649 RepID=UPI0026E366B7|nr:ferredoxin-type protein NapF [Colwellia sp. 1_MG-2023]MDO6446370.1 ferredoxin-type protein NapF [Colwellia sp. 1_MG-2023]
MTQPLENPSRRRLFKGKIAKQPSLPRLPWVKSESSFTELCNQCGDCISVCETNIIKKDELGLPFVDFNTDECTFCGKCQEVCQQPLFLDKNIIESNQVQPWPGTITINQTCLAQNNIMCQSCQDVCDTRAILFSYKSSSIPEPSINLTDCNQCGACISTCPQQAITLNLANNIEVAHV